MLKWTVGHRKAAGDKRSPSGGAGSGGGGGGPCYSIRRAAAKLHLSRRRNRTPSVHGFDPEQGGSGPRSKSCDKENRGRQQTSQLDILSPGSRDSLYMRLDTIPAALRDLSNHYQTSPVPPVVKRSSSGVRKIRTLRDSSEAVNIRDAPRSALPRQNGETSQLRRPPLRASGNHLQHSATATHASVDEARRPPPAHNSSTATVEPSLQIEYSPCPVRTTKSLLALRRRLTDVFVQPYRSFGTLHPPAQRSHDNPIYFALRQDETSPCDVSVNKKTDSEFLTYDLAKSPNGQNADDVPFKFRRKDPSLCLLGQDSRTDRTGEVGQGTGCPVSEDRNNCTLSYSSHVTLSPLSRNMASLRLSNCPRETSAVQQFPPSPFINCTTFIANVLSTTQHQPVQAASHDVTDPRFLSLCSVLESVDVRFNSSNTDAVNSPPAVLRDRSQASPPAVLRDRSQASPRDVLRDRSQASPRDVLRDRSQASPPAVLRNRSQASPRTPTAQGTVSRVLHYPEESPVKKSDGSQERIFRSTKRPSLRRARTATSNTEEGPPVKVQPVLSSGGQLILPTDETKPALEDGETCRSLSSPNTRLVRRSSDISRTRKTSRRCSKRLSRGNERAILMGLGDAVLASDSVVCDSDFGNEASSSFDICPDSREEDFVLKRQGGFRRRQRTVFRNTTTSDSCLLKIPERRTNKLSGLTLPNGIPSPFSPQDTYSWLPDLTGISNDMSCHIVGLPTTDSVQSSSHHAVRGTSLNVVGHLSSAASCCSIPSLFGLTLSKGIPSPPSPTDDDKDQYSSSVGIAGIQPLSSSPVPAAESSNVLTSKQKEGASDEQGTSSSDDTWDSHKLHLTKTPLVAARRVEQADCDVKSGGIAPFIDPSPMALVERRSRSRRCLLFASPCGAARSRRLPAVRSSSWRLHKESCQNRGELTLALYSNSGLLTIHVVSGRNLQRNGDKPCNAYVKVMLVPYSEQRTFHRTSVHRQSSSPWFDQKFSFEVLPTDWDKRVFVSAWHRDKENRRSEFLGCMSFAVKHAVKKEISGSFRLLSQNAGRTQNVPGDSQGGSGAKHPLMARQSGSSVEEIISIEGSDVAPTPATMERRKKKLDIGNEDSSFLRHLELEPTGDSGPGRGFGPALGPKGGRTPFTITKRLTRHVNGGFGFSIAWTQPPRVERVEAGLPADKAGLRPGDYVIFVEKFNVVTMPEEEILQVIRSCGNQLTLEVYRRACANGLVGGSTSTTTSLDLSKKRLQLPQVTFSSETEPLSREDARRRAVYQLLCKEQQYSTCLQFGISRFLVPLSERRDLLNANEHYTLFQNAEELLRLTEDTLEQLIHDEAEPYVQSLGRTYLAKTPNMAAGYRRYLSGLKNADCLLVAKTRNPDFMRLIVEPPVPRRRPDLTAFIHKPLEHYRDVLRLLQTVLNYTRAKDEDYPALLRVVQELQATYRDATVGSGLMEPEGDGRPLLSLQDLESRLVFTRCKPFVLSSPGRQWIFGGDLSVVEGRTARPFWALLFTDLIVFAKVSRDRVLFITEEPLSLLSVTQAFFSIRKKANEFRLLLDGDVQGTDSPAPGGCGPELPLTRNPKKSTRRRTISLRAPTAELKAVWQNLIQRQIIYLNTTRGGTPASSPLDSPDPPTTLSVATLDSFSLRRQTPIPECKSLGTSQRHLDDLIEHRCRQLGKSGASKGSALHLAQWMKGQLGGTPTTPDDEPEPEVWSPETLRRRSEQIQLMGLRNESRCEELELSDTERSQSRSTERSRSQTSSDSQVTVRSGGPEKRVSVCRQCHRTCLARSSLKQQPMAADNDIAIGLDEDDDDNDDRWGPLVLMGMSALNATVGLTGSTADPFCPSDVPLISVLPPTPDTTPKNSNFQWDDGDMICPLVEPAAPGHTTSQDGRKKYDADEDDDDDSLDQEPPYRSLTSPGGMRRFGTLASLEMLDDEEQVAEDSTDSDDHGAWDSDIEEEDYKKKQEVAVGSPHLEVVTQSLRGWTVRAGSFVAEKMALFERLGEESRAVAFLDRYLRPTADTQQQPACGDTPPEPNTTSSGDECSNSAATSGEEVWGTPTSGGELDEELVFPSTVSQESPADSTSSTGVGDEDTELMMDELLATPPFSSTARGFPPRRRLEPLPEEEDTDSPTTTPAPTLQKETPSPQQGSESGGVADNYHQVPVSIQQQQQGPGFFDRLRLHRRREEPHQVKNSRLLGFLSGRRSAEEGTSGKPLFRLFNRETVDDIPTTLPRQLTPRRQNGKHMERRFWKQLKRRRSGANAVISSPQVAA